jgi:hypothetical protein
MARRNLRRGPAGADPTARLASAKLIPVASFAKVIVHDHVDIAAALTTRTPRAQSPAWPAWPQGSISGPTNGGHHEIRRRNVFYRVFHDGA